MWVKYVEKPASLNESVFEFTKYGLVDKKIT